MHSPPQPDRDLKGVKLRKMKVFDGYGSRKGTQKTSGAVRAARFQCRYGDRQLISWLTSEGAEEEKQTGKQRSPWHCYHQPLIGTRPDEDSSTVAVKAGNPLTSVPIHILASVVYIHTRGVGSTVCSILYI